MSAESAEGGLEPSRLLARSTAPELSMKQLVCEGAGGALHPSVLQQSYVIMSGPLKVRRLAEAVARCASVKVGITGISGGTLASACVRVYKLTDSSKTAFTSAWPDSVCPVALFPLPHEIPMATRWSRAHPQIGIETLVPNTLCHAMDTHARAPLNTRSDPHETTPGLPIVRVGGAKRVGVVPLATAVASTPRPLRVWRERAAWRGKPVRNPWPAGAGLWRHLSVEAAPCTGALP
mmetsp:Transcript_31117/g.76366  ORF Transcript_31117/g.76366 Transcript_31117/m.76366 type:complete len:235 (+) Transcript_31117:1135-1839(+)